MRSITKRDITVVGYKYNQGSEARRRRLAHSKHHSEMLIRPGNAAVACGRSIPGASPSVFDDRPVSIGILSEVVNVWCVVVRLEDDIHAKLL